MPVKTIQKRSDSAVQHLRKIRDRKIRELLFCEGLKLVEEAFQSQLPIKEIYCVKGMEETVRNQLKLSEAQHIPLVLLSQNVMKFVSDLTSFPGLIAVCDHPKPKEDTFKQQNPLILILHQVQLPQNVGALVRTAEATGVTEVWVTKNSADPFSPKALRGSTGSAFRVPIRTGGKLHEYLTELNKRKVHVYAATQDGEYEYDRVAWNNPAALIVASEGSGFSIEEKKYLEKSVRISMKGHVESLNVGIAAAVCLFEALKQRRVQPSVS